jgi:uncharacterized protein GlcG (DUF336 family)
MPTLSTQHQITWQHAISACEAAVAKAIDIGVKINVTVVDPAGL